MNKLLNVDKNKCEFCTRYNGNGVVVVLGAKKKNPRLKITGTLHHHWCGCGSCHVKMLTKR